MLVPTLLSLLLSGAPAPAPSPPLALGQDATQSFAELEKAYDKAAFDWRRAERSALKEKREFTEPHPIHAYFPRFQALSEAGDGQASLWVGLNAEDLELSKEETAALKLAAFTRLVAGHVGDAELMQAFLKRAGRQSRWLEPKDLVGLLEPIHRESKDASLRETAAYEIARNYARMEGDEALAQAEAWYKKVISEFPDSKTAEKARTQLDGLQVAVGRIAPDFETTDVDGTPFKLSDYRGKVVVMDFWGFW